MGNCGAKTDSDVGHPSHRGGKKGGPKVEVLPEDTKADREIKVVLVGDVGIGKSSLILRYSEGTFPQDVGASIGCDFKTKVFKYKGKVFKLLLWDTAGQERFRTISSALYNDAEAFVLAFSITDKETLASVEKQWLVEIDHYAKPDTARVFVGLKQDLAASRQVTEAQAQDKGDEIGLSDYFELSAKTGSDEQIAAPFLRLVTLLED